MQDVRDCCIGAFVLPSEAVGAGPLRPSLHDTRSVVPFTSPSRHRLSGRRLPLMFKTISPLWLVANNAAPPTVGEILYRAQTRDREG